MRTIPIRTAAMLGVLLLLVAGCSQVNPFAEEKTVVSATFTDVVDLVPEGAVKYNDLDVGLVESIELTEDNLALVTMRLNPDAPVPSAVEAVVAKTSVLGERYIDLVPLEDDAPCCIEDGTRIEATSVRSDLEDLVAAGSDLLVNVGADAVRTTIEVGAEAFGGNEQLIAGFVDDVNVLVSTFDDNSEDLTALIDGLDRVTAAYAPTAAENAAVLADLREATAALQEQDEKLLDTLRDVTVLSDEAVDFLDGHQDEIENFVRRLRKLLEEVEQANGDIDRLLEIGPLYMRQLTRGALNGEAQVWLDFIVCGVQDEQGDVSRDCTPPNPGQRAERPPYYPVPEECWDDSSPCTGREE